MKYVLIDPRGTRGKSQNVLLAEKEMGLKLNLIGGKVEEGETFREAAIREMLEESAYQPENDILDLQGIFQGNDFEIAVFTGPVDNYRNPFSQDDCEPVYWHDWDTIKVDDRLMPDLRLIIPLTREAPPGWIVTETEEGLHYAYDPKRAFQAE